jgi:hypothetical protein
MDALLHTNRHTFLKLAARQAALICCPANHVKLKLIARLGAKACAHTPSSESLACNGTPIFTVRAFSAIYGSCGAPVC